MKKKNMYTCIALTNLAKIASEKEWTKEYYSPDEIVDILLNRSIDFEKIDKGLLEIKQLKDNRYVNIITCRKIGKNDKKVSKFYFHDKYRLCCPKERGELWDVAVARFQETESEESTSEYSEHFDWASDESDNESIEEYWDYIIPIKKTRNILSCCLFCF